LEQNLDYPRDVVAKEVVFYCGACRMEEQLFRSLMLLPIGVIPAQIGAMLLFGRSRKLESNEISIMTLLKNYWATECADERDKVFAMLGILPENNELKSLEISYHVTTAMLYLNIMEKITLHAIRPDSILYHVGMDSETLRRALRLDRESILSTRLFAKPALVSQTLQRPRLDFRSHCLVYAVVNSHSQGTREAVTQFSTRELGFDGVETSQTQWLTKAPVMVNDPVYFDVKPMGQPLWHCWIFRKARTTIPEYVGLAINVQRPARTRTWIFASSRNIF
jgi:hypothetical protein